MDNIGIYDLFDKGEIRLKSSMGIMPYHAHFKFTADQIEKSLREDNRFNLLSFSVEEEDKLDNTEACYIAEIEYMEEVYSIILDIVRSEGLDLRSFGFGNRVDEDAMKAAGGPPFFLQSTLEFSDSSIDSFHFQLKLMDAIVPEASLVIDFMSYRLLSAKWLKMSANSHTPPSSDYLYTIHGVYSDEEGEETTYWLHSHGLHRCGFPELEMVNIKQGVDQMNTLLNTIIKNFLTDPKPEMEEFRIGYDGLDITMCWQRWEDALGRFPENILGGIKDREDEDNVHGSPSGILFAVEEGELTSPEIYVKALSENPIYYVTNEETFRMSALAKERFGLFRQIFEKERKKKEE